MSLLDDITLGRHIPGDSLPHRLDARLKLAGIPVLIIAVFAFGHPLQLAGLGLFALLLIGLSGIDWRLWWRSVWMLRWLFLFTVLLHLFLTPGRTLFGTVWLSLDGLLLALLVCSRLALAIVFSSLLTLTTSPRELAAAFGALLAPLERFGVPVRDLTVLLLLVLHFIPVLREEAAELFSAAGASADAPHRGSLIQRGRAVRRLVAPLVLRLVDRADGLSRQMASGSPVIGEVPVPEPFRETGTLNFITLAAGGLLLVALALVQP